MGEVVLKILLFASHGHCYVSSTLYYGLCEVLGPENVIDYTGADQFHPPEDQDPTSVPYRHSYYPGTSRRENLPPLNKRIAPVFRGECGAVVVFDHVFRSLSEDCVRSAINSVSGRPLIVYVVCNDSCSPSKIPISADIVFQREICGEYSYHPIPIHIGLPAFEAVDRISDACIDIFYCGNPSHPLRIECIREVATSRFSFILSNRGGIGWPEYMRIMRFSRFALCPPGAGHDCMRVWEAVFSGAVPIFIGWNCLTVPEFFINGREAIFCKSPSEIVPMIESAFPRIDQMRAACLEKAKRFHTTRARAEYFLGKIGWKNCVTKN